MTTVGIFITTIYYSGRLTRLATKACFGSNGGYFEHLVDTANEATQGSIDKARCKSQKAEADQNNKLGYPLMNVIRRLLSKSDCLFLDHVTRLVVNDEEHRGEQQRDREAQCNGQVQNKSFPMPCRMLQGIGKLLF